MINVTLQDTISPKLKALALQIPTIAMNAINRTAFMVRTAEQDSIRSVFNQPTPWIQRVFVQQATVESLEAIVGPDVSKSESGFIYVQSGKVWEKILSPNVYGGPRPQKRFEERMVRAGLLPEGYHYAMPGKYMPMDTYGNPLRGELIKMLSWLQALEIGNRNLNGKRKNKTQQQGASYFIIYPRQLSNLPPGIYKRVGRQVQLMLLFTKEASYHPILPWFETAQKVIDDNLETKIKSEIYKVIGM